MTEINYEEEFNFSYWRVTHTDIDGVSFVGAFYRRFLASSDEVAAKFATTTFEVQKRALSVSLLYLAGYYATGKANAILDDIAKAIPGGR